MLHPSLDKATAVADNKYTLVVAVAKRARQLMEGYPPVVESKSGKPVSVALEEISQGKVKYQHIKPPAR